MSLSELFRRHKLETSSPSILQVSQAEAEFVVKAFLEPSTQLHPNNVIKNGSYAIVYRYFFAECLYAIKTAKSLGEQFSYCEGQLRGQKLLINRGYSHFAPYCPEPVADRFIVQRFVGGVPSYNLMIQQSIILDLDNYGLHIADPKANAIISPNFKSPVLIDLSEISTLVPTRSGQ